MESHSLYELNEYIQRVIALNFNDSIWIRAEISQVGISKGHYYVDLIEKDEDSEHIVASMNAIIWQKTAAGLKIALKRDFEQILQAGMAVLLKVKVNFHQQFGIKVFIEDIDPTFTFGNLLAQKKQTIDTLVRLELMDKNKSTQLNPVIQRVAVISSPTAAGLEDYLNHLKSNPYQYLYSNRLYPTAMQGAHVEKELLKSLDAIEHANTEFDCVVIIRGGGSKIDLMAFDGLEVCKAIANFPIPVLTGIGHEIDESVADMVSHTALRTPTAVADFMINRNAFFESSIIEIGNQIKLGSTDLMYTEQQNLAHLEQLIKEKSKQFIQNEETSLVHLENLIDIQTKHYIKHEKIILENLSNVVELLSIDSTLKRGYSITYHNGKPISKISKLKKGETIETQLSGGKKQSQIL